MFVIFNFSCVTLGYHWGVTFQWPWLFATHARLSTSCCFLPHTRFPEGTIQNNFSENPETAAEFMNNHVGLAPGTLCLGAVILESISRSSAPLRDWDNACLILLSNLLKLGRIYQMGMKWHSWSLRFEMLALNSLCCYVFQNGPELRINHLTSDSLGPGT